MGKGRDYIKEILERKGRSKDLTAPYDSLFRLKDIESAFVNSPKELPKEALKYFPIGTVACLEGLFRWTIKELIDLGEPYLERASEFENRNLIKFDLATVKALKGDIISVGDLVSHLIPFKGIASINAAISILIGTDYLKKLSLVHDRWAAKVMSQPPKPIIHDPDKVFRDVDKIFSQRHIFCHESASSLEIGTAEVQELAESVTQFAKAMFEFVEDVVHPNAPLTTAEINNEAAKSFRKANDELSRTCEWLLDNLETKRQSQFRELQGAWEDWREKAAQFFAGDYEGGSMWPSFLSAEKERITRERNKELKKYLEGLIWANTH